MVGVQALKNARRGHRAYISTPLQEKHSIQHLTTEQLNNKKGYSNVVRVLLN